MITKQCETCKEYLIPVKDVGWMHPNNPCKEEDGFEIVINPGLAKLNEIWTERMGTPTFGAETIIEAYSTAKAEITLQYLREHDNTMKRLFRWLGEKLRKWGN